MFGLCCGNTSTVGELCTLSPQRPALHQPCCNPPAPAEHNLNGGAGGASGDWTLSSEAAGAAGRNEHTPVGNWLEAPEAPPEQLVVTVEKIGKAKLGIDIEWRNRNNLRIIGVKEGVINQWNVDNPTMRVDPGDVIIEINGIVDDTERLVQEISTSRKLAMLVQKKQILISGAPRILPVHYIAQQDQAQDVAVVNGAPNMHSIATPLKGARTTHSICTPNAGDMTQDDRVKAKRLLIELENQHDPAPPMQQSTSPVSALVTPLSVVQEEVVHDVALAQDGTFDFPEHLKLVHKMTEVEQVNDNLGAIEHSLDMKLDDTSTSTDMATHDSISMDGPVTAPDWLLEIAETKESATRSPCQNVDADKSVVVATAEDLQYFFEDFKLIDIFQERLVYNVDSSEHGTVFLETLQQYYRCCRNFAGLLITTSSASVWSQANKTNGAAKVVPALPVQSGGLGDESVRVIVFEDKLNLHLGGAQNSSGSCNLRDVQTGTFVDFGIGQNGFACDRLFRHTLVHHSSEYNNVLVQVSILDAMANLDYFNSIIKRYSKPGEKLIVYVDVYGTVIWDSFVDSATCDDFGPSEILLSSMFRFVEVRPPSGGSASLEWEAQPALTLVEPQSMFSLVEQVLNQDKTLFQQFWTFKTCKRFLNAVASIAEIAWQNQEPITTNDFFLQYTHHIDCMRRDGPGVGIADSWLKCYDSLKGDGHTVVLNTFSPKSQEILRHLVPDPTQVPQFIMDYSSWTQSEVDLLLSACACFAR